MSLIESCLIESCVMPGTLFNGSSRAFVVGYSGSSPAMGFVNLETNTYTPVTAPLSGDAWMDVSFLGATGYSISNNNYIARTTNYGSSWSIVSKLPGASFDNGRAISVLSDGTLIAGGSSSATSYCTIWRSTDGGASFSIVFNTTGAQYFAVEDIQFINNLSGFACGYKNILKTTDGGVNWSVTYSTISAIYANKMNVITTPYFYYANVVAPLKASLSNDPPTVISGISTAYQTSGVYGTDASDMLFCGENGYIYRTNGITVTSSNQINTSNYYLNDLHFYGNNGVVCGQYGALYKSIDYGYNWTQITNGIDTGYTFMATKTLTI